MTAPSEPPAIQRAPFTQRSRRCALSLLSLLSLLGCALFAGCGTTRRAYVGEAAGPAPSANEAVFVYRPILRGERVVIHLRDGHTLAGRLVDGDDSTLVIERRPPILRRDIHVVELDIRRDPFLDFFLGTAVGTGATLFFVLAALSTALF